MINDLVYFPNIKSTLIINRNVHAPMNRHQCWDSF